MNRHDEIQAKARDIASNIHADPVARDAMADDLIKLIGMMIGANPREPVWTHVDRRPENLRTAEKSPACCKPNEAAHVCHLYTGGCCYSNDEVCGWHG